MQSVSVDGKLTQCKSAKTGDYNLECNNLMFPSQSCVDQLSADGCVDVVNKKTRNRRIPIPNSETKEKAKNRRRIRNERDNERIEEKRLRCGSRLIMTSVSDWSIRSLIAFGFANDVAQL